MATWSLLLMHPPLMTPVGSTGLICELTKATSRSMNFSVEDQATMAFNMPGNHYETSLIEPTISDVLVYRDSDVVQRFRVASRKLAKNDGKLTAQFTCVSYRGMLNAWMVRADQKRSWGPAPAAAVEQTDIVWTLVNAAQQRESGSWNMSKGPNPTLSQTRTDLVGSTVNFQPEEYFAEGTPMSEVVAGLAEVQNGFDWDIVPDPADEMRALKFMFWTDQDGGRNQHTGLSPFILDDGGNVAGWEHDITPSAYGNVLRLNGNIETQNNFTGATVNEVWLPADKNPEENPAPEGRWERAIGRADLTSQASVVAAAPEEYAKLHDFLPVMTVELTRGRWQGPDELWLGDLARIIITEPARDAGPDDWVLYMDEEAKVVDIDIVVDDLGAETVSLTLNGRQLKSSRDSRNINGRLRRLELR